MTPQERYERREKVMELFKESVRQDLIEFRDIQRNLAAQYSTAMNNLAFSSGALAAGAVVLLSTGADVDKKIVAFGVAVLLIEVFLIFARILYSLDRDWRAFVANRSKELGRSHELLSLWDNLREGKITEEVFDSKLAEAAKLVNQNTSINREELITQPPAVNYWGWAFMALLGLGLFLIVLGILIPYFC